MDRVDEKGWAPRAKKKTGATPKGRARLSERIVTTA